MARKAMARQAASKIQLAAAHAAEDSQSDASRRYEASGVT
jgi:hypothetical protein